MNAAVLIIDDDASVRHFLRRGLESHGFAVNEADSGDSGIAAVIALRPDVVLLDVRMPGIDGVSALQRIHEIDDTIAVIMTTSVNEIETVRRTLRNGAYDYLLKPLDFPTVVESIGRALERRNLTIELRRHQQELESLVLQRTCELKAALQRIEAVYSQTIFALGSALETRDVETNEHCLRVSRYATSICRRLGICDPERLKTVEWGSSLHDIGKIGVPDHILRKPGPLSDEEWAVMKEHPRIGAKLLEGIEFLNGAASIVLHHHERWDGGGYPQGLSGTDIPLEARAFAVADAFDALTSDRPYRKAMSAEAAREIIAAEAGTHFCPDSVSAFLTAYEEFAGFSNTPA